VLHPEGLTPSGGFTALGGGGRSWRRRVSCVPDEGPLDDRLVRALRQIRLDYEVRRRGSGLGLLMVGTVAGWRGNGR
jgi:hypothetical protein